MKRIFAMFSLLCLLLSQTGLQAEESTWVYAVRISATVQITPPQITLNWQQDDYGANSYKIYRKAKDATSWGSATTLSGTITNYTDTNVSIGTNYEYRIVKAASLGYTGYGYIYTGINAPLTEDRGKLLLIVATNSTVGLDNEMAQLQSDLTGDGWQVQRHDVSSNDTPAHVRSIISNDYHADPINVKSVFLFGHVPIFHSGNLNYDGHLARSMPADVYYADVDGVWTTNTEYLPTDVELELGRVDLANMPGVGAPVPWGSETELLRNYLNKDHNWRHKITVVQRKALMGNRRGDEGGLATAASGYRNFETFVGHNNTIEANTEDNAPPTDRWIAKLKTDNYLWAYGCGGGDRAAISELGTNGQYFDAWSTDLVSQDAKAVFVMLFGSWFGAWDQDDDFMRAILVTPGVGLTACLSGQPHWFLHHMGLGETIGYGTKLSMNNTNLYQSQSNIFSRAIYIALMGDPTLRMDAVTPVSGLNLTAGASGIGLTWTASTDAVAGYHVYRASSASGPFTRLTSSLVTATNYTDTSTIATNYVYMVRAIQLLTTPSGSYYNPSQGVFGQVSQIAIVPPPVITITASKIGNNFMLKWNSQSGTQYHIEAKGNVNTAWTDISGTVTATNSATTWSESISNPQRFYRVVSP